MTDTWKNVPALRDQRSDIGTAHRAGKLITRVADEALKYLHTAESQPSDPSPSFEFLLEAIPSLGVAANCLIQDSNKNLSSKEIAIIQLEKYSEMRYYEIGENFYSKTLQEVADILKSGKSIKEAIFWIMGASYGLLGFSLGLNQFETLQSLLRMTGSKGPPAERLEELEQAARTRMGLYQQDGDEEGMEIYKPLLKLIQTARSVKELEQLCERLEILNQSLELAKDRLLRGAS